MDPDPETVKLLKAIRQREPRLNWGSCRCLQGRRERSVGGAVAGIAATLSQGWTARSWCARSVSDLERRGS